MTGWERDFAGQAQRGRDYQASPDTRDSPGTRMAVRPVFISFRHRRWRDLAGRAGKYAVGMTFLMNYPDASIGEFFD